MRIWSKKLIPVLPTKQLKAMRYELGDMIKQYPNIKHPLVKFANNYDISYLWWYLEEVRVQIESRGIKTNQDYDLNINKIVSDKTDNIVECNKAVFKEDNHRYLKQCLYNLQEKYDRGIVSEEEWRKIEDAFNRYL